MNFRDNFQNSIFKKSMNAVFSETYSKTQNFHFFKKMYPKMPTFEEHFQKHKIFEKSKNCRKMFENIKIFLK